MDENPTSLAVEIRPLIPADQPFLWEMLYHALYVRPGDPPFPREIVRAPEIGRYVNGWGKADDLGFAALWKGQPVGAAWLRLLTETNRGFGYVNDTMPELSVAVLPGYRGLGIGSKLLAHLLAAAKPRHEAVSLSVSADNPAKRLYQRLGFDVFKEVDRSLTMVKRLA
jgi:ribosomal protein S18 acetylase RimI-like enzyme